MEYERFYHFGSDMYAGKWYLLSGSNAMTQRFLCRKDFADAENLKTFGDYTLELRGRRHNYCYVVVNIFNIPYNKLHNFFVATCSEDDAAATTIKTDDALVDINFKRQFNSGVQNRLPTINVSTNVEEMTSDYFSGISDIAPLTWDIDLPVAPCTMPSTSNGGSTSSRTYEAMDTSEDNYTQAQRVVACKRPNPSSSGPSVSSSSATPPKLVAAAAPAPLPEVVESSAFPSEVVVAGGDSAFLPNGLANLAQYFTQRNHKDYFGEDMLGRIIYRGGDIYALGDTNDVIPMSPKVLEMLRGRTLSYDTWYSKRNKNALLTSLRAKDPSELNKFQDFLRSQGDNIVRLVDSSNVNEFVSIIEEARNVNPRNVYMYTLFGLFTYLKNRRDDYTTFMEIAAAQFTRNGTYAAISNILIRGYFLAKREPIKITDNAVNLYHFQDLDVTNTEFDNLVKFMNDETSTNDFVNMIGAITGKSTFSVNVSTNTISKDSYFCNNLFALDNFANFIIQNELVYSTTRNVLNGANVTVDRYPELPNIFNSYTYGGFAAFRP